MVESSKQEIPRETRVILLAIWCCFSARALFYCGTIPVWEGYDEYAHFALVQYVAIHHGRFPLDATPPAISRAVAESRRLTPAPWLIRDANSGILSYEDYFSLPTSEQTARRRRLEELPVEWARQESFPRESLYEAQQPPLYYWILAPFYGLFERLSLPAMVWLLRSLTILIASLAVPFGFLAARQVFRGQDAMALGVAIVVASFPELFIVIAHVSNEGLSVATGSLFVLLALRILEQTPSVGRGVWLGVALGAALLSKAYFLALLPLAATVLCYAWFRNVERRSLAVWQALAALATAFALSAWWYVHNFVGTGSLTGQFEDAQAIANHDVSLVRALFEIHWAKLFDFIATSHIWLGTWSFLSVRAWMYRVIEVLAFLALLGVSRQLIRERSGLPLRRELAVLLLPYVAMIAGLCFHAAQVFRIRGAAATVGYYLYALVLPEAILLVAGLACLMPRKLRSWPIAIAVFSLIALEQFGDWFLLFPYYSGLIRHNPNGRLPFAHMEQWWNGGTRAFFDALSRIGPTSSTVMLAGTTLLYGLATIALLCLAWRITARSARQSTF